MSVAEREREREITVGVKRERMDRLIDAQKGGGTETLEDARDFVFDADLIGL